MNTIFNFDIKDIEAIRSMVADAERIVITCHVAPDGDALGSTLGLYHLLEAMGKRPAVITPDVPTASLMFLPGANNIIAATRHAERAKVHFQAADLIVCLDFNALMRVDKMQTMLADSRVPKILIDHHLNPEAFADVTISRPKASSTCYLLYEVIKTCGWEHYMTREAAECIYCGMMTDTGNFSFNSNDPGLYEDIAALLRLGINKDYIYKMACDTESADRLRLNAYAIYKKLHIYSEHQAAMIVLTRDELSDFNYVKGDTEGLVNRPLSIPEVTYSLFLREDENYVKVSMRSKGDFPVNKMCEEHFGGGGHLNAAGGELHCSLDEAIAIFEQVMPLYDCYLHHPASDNRKE